jgi:hypothetical protein
MRKKTIAGISFLISVACVYGAGFLARSQGVQLPFAGVVSHLVAALVLTPVVVLVLTRLNRPLLVWRKTRGRDIELEERYEIGDLDFISLRPSPSERDEPR